MKVDRLVSIIMILLDKERIDAQELADMFEYIAHHGNQTARTVDPVC